MKIDKEYDNAIRFYLDNILNAVKFKYNKPKYDMNVAKSLGNYLRDISGIDNYKLETPLSCLWNVTSACNFRCIHCLYNDTEYSSKNDLTHEQAMNLVDELINDFGITFVVLTGGEIFTRQDILEIIQRFKENNVAVRLQTNAALIKDSQIDEIAKIFNPYTDSVHVSLDGVTSDTYKKIRRTNDFEKIITNIKKMISKNIRVVCACVVNPINYNEIADMYELCRDLGVYEFIVSRTALYNDSHKELIISERDLFLLYSKLIPCKKPDVRLTANFFKNIELINLPEVKKILEEEKYKNLITQNFTKIKSRTCHYNEKITIDADGTLYLCIEALSRKIGALGSYKDNSLLNIWKKRKNSIIFKPREIEKMKCNSCKYNKFCDGGCIVQNYMQSSLSDTLFVPCS